MRPKIFLTLIAAASLAGCATAPSRPGAPAGSLIAQRVFVGSRPYLPSAALARELRAQEHWDTDAQVLFLTAAGHELRAAAGMRVVLLDGSPYLLPAAPVMERGRLLLPQQLWTDRLARWSVPERIPSPPVFRPLRTIVLDAGHGGHDPGAVGPTGLREKAVTLEVAKSLRDLLVRDGFRVIMTRYDDRFISLGGRSAVANREEADLFVSVHANASRRRSISGFEAYYLSEATDDQARALEAAENAALPEEIGRPISSDTEAIIWDLLYTEHRAESLELASDICRGMSGAGIVSRNRGVKSARFAVLKGVRMPAVLVEIGFVSHRDEEVRLRRADHRRRLAEGIRQGILRFRDRLEREYARAR